MLEELMSYDQSVLWGCISAIVCAFDHWAYWFNRPSFIAGGVFYGDYSWRQANVGNERMD